MDNVITVDFKNKKRIEKLENGEKVTYFKFRSQKEIFPKLDDYLKNTKSDKDIFEQIEEESNENR